MPSADLLAADICARQLALADTLHEFENLFDQLYDCGGRLHGALVQASLASGGSSASIPQIHRAFSEALSLTSEANAAVIRGHRLTAKVAKDRGVDVHMYGDGRTYPDDNSPKPNG